ncbi:MAG: hypothetical protein ACRCZ2_06915 [Fusobacteriaceae bacterium]
MDGLHTIIALKGGVLNLKELSSGTEYKQACDDILKLLEQTRGKLLKEKDEFYYNREKIKDNIIEEMVQHCEEQGDMSYECLSEDISDYENLEHCSIEDIFQMVLEVKLLIDDEVIYRDSNGQDYKLLEWEEEE